MADSSSNQDAATPRRPRAPTITIDTTAVGASQDDDPDPTAAAPRRYSPISPTDDTVSPTSIANPLSQTWTSSDNRTNMPQRQPSAASATSDYQGSRSFDSDNSRPQSPHNVSSPVTSRGNDRVQNFLAVPNNYRSRQNSVDSEDGIRSIASASSIGETVAATASWQPDKGEKSVGMEGDANNDEIMKATDALKPDAGKEADFEVQNNPFAYSPGQLTKMFNPKSLAAFYALGGLSGMEKGLRSNRETGLSVDEKHLDGTVSFQDVSKKDAKLTTEGVESSSPEAPVARANTAGRESNDAFADRKRVYGDNRIPEKKGKSFLQLVWITYNDKVLILLSIAAVVSLAIGLYQTFGTEHDAEHPGVEWVEGVAIIVAIVIVVLVGSLNDWQKERQFAKLNKKKQDRVVRAVRSGQTVEVSVFDIMAGDVIHLEPGDLIPVDGILIQGYNVKCDESQATGESDIIKKRGGDEVFAAIENGENLKKQDPFIQSGARVMEGAGTFLATSTGVYSSYGKTMMALDEDPEITPLQSKLNVIAEYIAKLGGAAGLLLFLVLFIKFLVALPHNPATPAEKGQNFLNIFIVVVTIIVVAVPEGLPLAVTLALAFATTRMLRENNLVRHLKACEVMGNATTICSDKTGTLTQNKMLVVSGTVGTSHRFGGDGENSSAGPTAKELVSSLGSDVKDILLKSISMNSTAFEGDVDGVKTFIGSKTETALLTFAKEHLGMGPVSEERSNSKVLQLIPFDSGRKCMGAVVQLPNGKARLYVKGASEILLAKCTEMLRDPSQDLARVPLSEESAKNIRGLIDSYASRSLRTIGLVFRDFETWPPRNSRRTDGEVKFEDIFQRMTFLGMVGIQDPLREGVADAVRSCQVAGVMVRMVTGDNKLTAQAIAKECGILQPEGLVMEGPEFRNLSRMQQESIIPRLQVLARSSPEDKRILVRRLKDLGETVAVTGDGTNDAPALKLADVGFSMGIAGTEVAKEASAIILMDDNFNSIVKALKWGRAVNDAVKRFLQFQLTVNITAVILTFVTAVSNEKESSVLTAVQLLWVNLIMDTLAALALATDPPQDSVLDRKPEPRGSGIISTTMWKMIIGQAIYQLVITLLIYYGSPSILSYDDNIEKAQLNTLVFNTFVWMQIFNQWNNRRLDNKFNIFEGLFQNWFFIGINTLMCGAQVLIIFVGGDAFNIVRVVNEQGQKSPPQTGAQWGYAIFLGILSIPVGAIIRLIPDSLLASLVPEPFKRKSPRLPGLTVSDEERFNYYPAAFTEVRDELAWLKRIKGGRLNNLKFAMQHPREALLNRSRSKSPVHSRSNSVSNKPFPPSTPVREDSVGSKAPTPTPDSRKRSRSMRSRSNSALGAPTVMAGIIAGSIAAGWSPVERNGDDTTAGQPPRPSPLSQQQQEGAAAPMFTEEPENMEGESSRPRATGGGTSLDVPRLSIPKPPADKERKSTS
ncbi:Calcium-transporting ATPase 2 [Apiospora rasikravindrae]|uniref:Calcium-transporting ATPase n=1 Tax=Apiospora rasikravindrae TaxID=990691 RepID=A0ABR1TE68_9PEZI